MSNHKITAKRSSAMTVKTLLGILGVSACLSLHAYADTLPACTGNDLLSQESQENCTIANPGGATIVTESYTATITYMDTAVTNNVADYSTTVVGLLNGTPVYSMTFLAPFSDPSVTAAIAAADGILSGDGASFGGPSLFSSSSVLQSSVVTPPATYNCLSAYATGSTYVTGATITPGTTATFGPSTINIGGCNTDIFNVYAGQTDTNTDIDFQFTIPVETITTDTYLDSQIYDITGTTNTVPAPTPEPASLSLLLSGIGAIGWLRNRKTTVKRFSAMTVKTLLGILGVSACLSLHAYADTLPACTSTVIDYCEYPNPGGATIVTDSSSATITYIDTAVTNTVNDYSTTLVGLVNGTQVYSMTLLAPFSDPSVTAAIATADGILSGDGATFGTPSLVSSTSVLQNSVITPPLTYNCISAEATGLTYLTGYTSTTTTTVGPATITTAGDCNTDTLYVESGQTDINTNLDQQFSIPVETITTDTYLDSQTYDITGTTNTVPAPTPEPASVNFLLSGIGAIGWLRSRKPATKPQPSTPLL